MSLQCAGGSYPLLNFLGSGNLALLDLEMANCRGSRLANGLTGRAVLAGVSVSLVANGVQFMNNSAETNFTVDYACGGAVRADGPSAFANCTFAHNSITVHPPAISGRGGALCTGSVTAVTNCTFFYNSVVWSPQRPRCCRMAREEPSIHSRLIKLSSRSEWAVNQFTP